MKCIHTFDVVSGCTMHVESRESSHKAKNLEDLSPGHWWLLRKILLLIILYLLNTLSQRVHTIECLEMYLNKWCAISLNIFRNSWRNASSIHIADVWNLSQKKEFITLYLVYYTCLLHVYYMFTTCVLHVYYICTTCLLYIYYMRTTPIVMFQSSTTLYWIYLRDMVSI